MPIKAARLETHALPPSGLGGPGGKSGSTISQSSSGTTFLATVGKLGMQASYFMGFERSSKCPPPGQAAFKNQQRAIDL